MSSRPLNDLIVELIVSGLPLSRKLELRSVNKQFLKCIEQSLAEEESLQIVSTYGKDLDVFVNNDNKNRIDLNKIGLNFDDNHCLAKLLSKLEGIKCLEFDNNIQINNRMIEWFIKRFPKLSSLSLLDYRCDYLTIDWMSIGDKLSNNLTSLEIECRLNQQISDKTLAILVTKLNRLEDLTIVCPRRRLTEVFAAFGPNLVRLRITYCRGLYVDELMALINGNGKRLQELEIHYQIYGFEMEQNKEFALICNHLTDLKSFTFNHLTLSMEALPMISKLKKLRKFCYNYSGFCPKTSFLDSLGFRNKYIEFQSFTEIVPSLQSLSLFNVELRPQILYNWKNLFPNVSHLYLKCVFLCGCQTRYPQKCFNCIKLCFQSLSELKNLRSIDFSHSFILMNCQWMLYLHQIHFLRINCYLLEDRIYFLNILSSLSKMANLRKGRPLVVTLYNLRCGPITRFRRMVDLPPNLRITFESISSKY